MAPPTPELDVARLMGRLEANADEARRSQDQLTRTLADLPDKITAAVDRAIAPIELRLSAIEKMAALTRDTVARWKGAIAVVVVLATVLGWIIAQFTSLKRMIGIHE